MVHSQAHDKVILKKKKQTKEIARDCREPPLAPDLQELISKLIQTPVLTLFLI